MEAALTLIVILFVLVLLNVAVWRWGQDSTEPLDSPEWERRRVWRGYGAG
jgi:hypothetical protein